VPLSALVVKQRIFILCKDLRENVISSIKERKYFAIQLDGTSHVSSDSQLLAYVKYWGSFEYVGEMFT